MLKQVYTPIKNSCRKTTISQQSTQLSSTKFPVKMGKNKKLYGKSHRTKVLFHKSFTPSTHLTSIMKTALTFNTDNKINQTTIMQQQYD